MQILSVIPPDEFQHWIGVGEIMREEARERIHAHFEVFAKWMRDKQDVDPELVIREGEPVPEILAQIREDAEHRRSGAGGGAGQERARTAGHAAVPILGHLAGPDHDRAG